MSIEIRTEKATGKHKNVLAGAVNIAIEQAERYGTKLVVKRNGKIQELSPNQMRRHLKSSGK